MIGIPAVAGAGEALADTVAPRADPAGSVSSQVQSRRLGYGQNVVLNGSAPAGHDVALEFSAGGSSAWSTLSSGTVSRTGGFRLAAPLRRSGLVRVVDSSASSSTVPTASTASASSSSATGVSVAARLHVPARSIVDLGGRPVTIGGHMLPAVGGRLVRLQGRSGHGWKTLATARTGSGGRFRLHFRPSAPGEQQLRVRFSGDQSNAWSGAHAGRLVVLEPTVASWYNDAGNTACGFHAYYGVANRDLPCGTQVTFSNGGRTVTATVDDRGPYVGGRDWDLNQNTASALGFGGVGQVWASQ